MDVENWAALGKYVRLLNDRRLKLQIGVDLTKYNYIIEFTAGTIART